MPLNLASSQLTSRFTMDFSALTPRAADPRVVPGRRGTGPLSLVLGGELPLSTGHRREGARRQAAQALLLFLRHSPRPQASSGPRSPCLCQSRDLGLHWAPKAAALFSRPGGQWCLPREVLSLGPCNPDTSWSDQTRLLGSVILL